MNPATITQSLGHWVNVGPHAEHVRRCAGWVATAVDMYCDTASTARATAVTRYGPAQHEVKQLEYGNWLQRLLRRPCASVLPRDLWQRLVLRYWLTTGNVYLYRQVDGGSVLALWPIATHFITPIRNERSGLIDSLIIAGQQVGVPYSEFVHLKRPNLLDPYGEGLSPISEHALSVELNDSVDQVRLRAFQSPSRPNTMFGSDLPLSDDDVTRNEARLMQKWKLALPIFLDSGLKPLGPASIGPQEVDYLHTTRVTREEIICGIYRVPQLLAGFSEPGQPPSEGLIQGAATLFATTAVDPALHAIYSQLLHQLSSAPDIEARVESTAPVNRNQQRADEAVDRRECIRSVDEIRTSRGLTPLNTPWSSDPQWRPDNAPSYSADPAPNASPTDRGTSRPGPKNSNPDTLAAETAGPATQ